MMAWARSSSCRTRPQAFERLVGGEDHRALAPMPLVDDVEEHVGGVGAVGEIADLVDDEHGRMRVGRQRLRELPGAKRGGEIVDERRRPW